MQEKRAFTEQELRAILAEVRFQNTVMDFHWQFEVQEIEAVYKGQARFFDAVTNGYVEAENPRRKGWLIWATFERPETHTGKVERGRGRDEVIWEGWTESAIVKTAWVVVRMLVEHELMEGMKYEGYRFFDPHNSVQELIDVQKRKGVQD